MGQIKAADGYVPAALLRNRYCGGNKQGKLVG